MLLKIKFTILREKRVSCLCYELSNDDVKSYIDIAFIYFLFIKRFVFKVSGFRHGGFAIGRAFTS